MNEGLALFGKYNDKDWGLVDCISIAVSKTLNIEDIFTTDKHFEQAGFRKLL